MLESKAASAGATPENTKRKVSHLLSSMKRRRREKDYNYSKQQETDFAFQQKETTVLDTTQSESDSHVLIINETAGNTPTTSSASVLYTTQPVLPWQAEQQLPAPDIVQETPGNTDSNTQTYQDHAPPEETEEPVVFLFR